MAKTTKTQVKPTIKKKVTEKKKKKIKLSSPKILLTVHSTYNNTIVSATDFDGSVLASSSCGRLGFKGSKKSTAYAATKVGEDVAGKAILMGAKEAEVVIRGIGVGRQSAVKGIRAGGLKITMLLDRTSVPHGGCKSRKAPKK